MEIARLSSSLSQFWIILASVYKLYVINLLTLLTS